MILQSLYELCEASKKMEGQKDLRYHEKDLQLCSEDELKYYWN